MNGNPHAVIVTKDGLEELKKEYNELIQNKRPTAVTRLAAARDQGDLSENSEYTAAKEDLTFMDGRIAELEDIIHGAKVVSSHGKTTVDVGCKVTVDVKGKKEEFNLVGEFEVDLKEKKISHESPLGKALMGKRVGDQVEVQAPVGKVVYKIVQIA
jgi:transcription elongation factor GreA